MTLAAPRGDAPEEGRCTCPRANPPARARANPPPSSTVAKERAPSELFWLVALQPQQKVSTTFRNRHIGSRYFQVRNYVRNQQLLPTHVPTKLNVADLFTKAITEFQLFETHRRALGLEDPGES